MEDGVSLISTSHPGSKPILQEDQVESFAIKCALGNNGGEWASHYTSNQKMFWRQFIWDLANEVLKKD